MLRALRITLLLLTLAAAGVAATAWLVGDQQELPFEYEGFD